MQDVHVTWTTINRIDCEFHIILTSTASDRNTGCFVIQKVSKKVARWHCSHSGFLSWVESFQNYGIFYSIGKSNVNGWNFSKKSHLMNLNQGQDCSKNIPKKLYVFVKLSSISKILIESKWKFVWNLNKVDFLVYIQRQMCQWLNKNSFAYFWKCLVLYAQS